MKNVKYTLKWTNHYDESVPNNNYNDIITGIFAQNYDLIDYLNDRDIHNVEVTENAEYILYDEYGDETGERYLLIERKETDKELQDLRL